MPRISIIIPTLNEEKYIGKLLQSIQAQSKQPDEVFVVDAGSHDNTRDEIGHFPEVRFLPFHPPVGGQRSEGGRSATGDILFFLDADTELTPDFIERSLRHIERQKLEIACPYYWPQRSTPGIKLVFAFFNSMFFLFQKIIPSGAGPCIIVKKELFEKVGGFQGQLVYDDIAFIRSASRKGRFGMVHATISVSDRRFKTFGTWRTFGKYLLLSFLFSIGAFRLANSIKYPFGRHKF